MIVLNLELDNIYSFKDFKVNFSYPKRVIKSTIEGEYLITVSQFIGLRILFRPAYWTFRSI